MTDYQRGEESGGFNQMKILAGGRVRWSLTVKDDADNLFMPGNLAEVDSNGELVIATGDTEAIKALVLERRSTANNVSADETLGSGMASILMDDAIVESAELSSGISFAIGDYVYDDGTGHLTNSNASCDIRLGRVIAVPTSKVRFYYPGAFANLYSQP
jgi:hypothetical protein